MLDLPDVTSTLRSTLEALLFSITKSAVIVIDGQMLWQHLHKKSTICPFELFRTKLENSPQVFRFVGTSHPENELGIFYSARGSFPNVFTIDILLESNMPLQDFACGLQLSGNQDVPGQGRKTAVWAGSLRFYFQVDGEMDQLYGRNTHDPPMHTQSNHGSSRYHQQFYIADVESDFVSRAHSLQSMSIKAHDSQYTLFYFTRTL